MYKIIAVLVVSFGALQAVQAAPQSCQDQAAAKHLAGAAKNSFMKKCERTSREAATEQCNSQADAKKLHGAARTSFVKKCVRTAAE